MSDDPNESIEQDPVSRTRNIISGSVTGSVVQAGHVHFHGSRPDALVRKIVGGDSERFVPAQLPPGIGDFTGRADMIALIGKRLSPHDSGVGQALVLTALSGKGGVGKTTLAVHAAHLFATNFADGQLYVNLRGMEAERLDPHEVLAQFLMGLGVPAPAIPENGDARVGLYRSTLAARQVLVVLDNGMPGDLARRRGLRTGASFAGTASGRQCLPCGW